MAPVPRPRPSAVVGVAVLCATAGAVPGTSRTLADAAAGRVGAAHRSISYDVARVPHGRRVHGRRVVPRHAAGAITPVADAQGAAAAWRAPTTIALPPGPPRSLGRSACGRSRARPRGAASRSARTYDRRDDRRPSGRSSPPGLGRVGTGVEPRSRCRRARRGDARRDLVHAASSVRRRGLLHRGDERRVTTPSSTIASAACGSRRSTLPDPTSPKLHACGRRHARAISCTKIADCVVVGAVAGRPRRTARTYGCAEVDRRDTWTPTVFTPFSHDRDSLNAVSCATATHASRSARLGPTLTARPAGSRRSRSGQVTGRGATRWILPWKFWAPVTYRRLAERRVVPVGAALPRRRRAGRRDRGHGLRGHRELLPGPSTRGPTASGRTRRFAETPALAAARSPRARCSARSRAPRRATARRSGRRRRGPPSARASTRSRPSPSPSVAGHRHRAAVTDVTITRRPPPLRGHLVRAERGSAAHRSRRTSSSREARSEQTIELRHRDDDLPAVPRRAAPPLHGRRHRRINAARRYGPIRRVGARSAREPGGRDPSAARGPARRRCCAGPPRSRRRW